MQNIIIKILIILWILVVKKAGKYPTYKMNFYNPITYIFVIMWCVVIFFVEGFKAVWEWLTDLAHGEL